MKLIPLIKYLFYPRMISRVVVDLGLWRINDVEFQIFVRHDLSFEMQDNQIPIISVSLCICVNTIFEVDL